MKTTTYLSARLIAAVGAAVMSFTSVASCAAPPAPPGTASAPSPKQLVANGALAIDVRSQAEYDEGHASKTKLIPIDDFAQRLTEIDVLTGGNKTAPIVVVCKSGRRAGRAKEILEKSGYTNVTNGGSWQNLAE